jgi:hypothetical protein
MKISYCDLCNKPLPNGVWRTFISIRESGPEKTLVEFEDVCEPCKTALIHVIHDFAERRPKKLKE